MSESNCGCALALPAFGQAGKVLLTPLQVFVEVKARQDGRFSSTESGRSSIFNAGGKSRMSLEQTVKLLGGQDCGCSKHVFVESCIFDPRFRATRSEQMLKTMFFTTFLPLIRSMIEITFLSLAWLSSCLAQTTWSSIRTITLSKSILIPRSFGHDNSYLLQLITFNAQETANDSN